MKKLAVCMLALGLLLTGCGSNDEKEWRVEWLILILGVLS